MVAPYLCGYGGDLFAIVWDGELHGYLGSGRSPARADIATVSELLGDAPLLVGPLLDAAHMLRRTAVQGGIEPGVQTAADLAAALLGYQDHTPMP